MTESKVMEGRICDPDVMLILTEQAVGLSHLVAQVNLVVRGYDQGTSFSTAMAYLNDKDVTGWRMFWLVLNPSLSRQLGWLLRER